MNVHYHPGKDNVLTDALSKLSIGSVTHTEEEKKNQPKMFTGLLSQEFALVQFGLESSLVAEVKEKHDSDLVLLHLKGVVHQQRVEVFSKGDYGVLREAICIIILTYAHNTRYSFYEGATKMYRDIREVFQWNDTKMEIVDFVAKCPTC